MLILAFLVAFLHAAGAQDPSDCPSGILPGVNYIGNGFDVVTGEKKALSVINISYTARQTVYNPRDASKKYCYPDQFGIDTESEGGQETISSTHYSAESYARSTALSFGIDISKAFGAFSLSADVKTAESYIQKRESYCAVTSTSAVAVIYQVSLGIPDTIEPSAMFLKALATLPATYVTEGDKQKYSTFIQYYGTHYLASGHFGGMGTLFIAVNSEQAQTHSSDEIEAQASIQFKVLQGHADYSQLESWFVGEGSSRSFNQSALVGGDQSLAYSIANWDKWIASYYDEPELIHNEKYPATLSPLSTLIASFNQTSASNFVLAVQDYYKANGYPSAPNCSESVLCGAVDGSDVCCDVASGSQCCSSADKSALSCCARGVKCLSCGQDIAICAPEGSTCCPGAPDGVCDADHKCCGGQCIENTQQCCEGATGCDQSCCHSQCMPSGGNCCDQSHYCAGDYPACCTDGCCPSDHPQCCGQYCWEQGDVCCQDGSWGCDSGNRCCWNGSDQWCCSGGDGCITFPVDGCNPFNDGRLPQLHEIIPANYTVKRSLRSVTVPRS